MRELGTWMPSDLGSHNRSAHWSRMTSFWTEPASFRANQSQAIVFPSVAPQSLRFVFNDSSACCVVFDEFQFRFFSFHFACSAWLDIAFLILHVSRTISPFFGGGGSKEKSKSSFSRASYVSFLFSFCLWWTAWLGSVAQRPGGGWGPKNPVAARFHSAFFRWRRLVLKRVGVGVGLTVFFFVMAAIFIDLSATRRRRRTSVHADSGRDAAAVETQRRRRRGRRFVRGRQAERVPALGREQRVHAVLVAHQHLPR